jgi:hypothetical protein
MKDQLFRLGNLVHLRLVKNVTELHAIWELGRRGRKVLEMTVCLIGRMIHGGAQVVDLSMYRRVRKATLVSYNRHRLLNVRNFK